MNFPAELLNQCWFLAGPTAVGKSAAAMRLADQLNAEILSLDSMAVYRGMDIGTAKPEQSERAAVRHHLVDLAEPNQNFSVGEYMSAALSAVREVIGRGHVPLFCGGTGLYLKAILRGVFDGPQADWNLRRQLEQQAQRHGPKHLYDSNVPVLSDSRMACSVKTKPSIPPGGSKSTVSWSKQPLGTAEIF